MKTHETKIPRPAKKEDTMQVLSLHDTTRRLITAAFSSDIRSINDKQLAINTGN